ncbi:MAG: type II and III secretion system protein family protein [Rugosibacter sp.]|nr:type II and III secretion system protein family protein [Rugosibacter sp.]
MSNRHHRMNSLPTQAVTAVAMAVSLLAFSSQVQSVEASKATATGKTKTPAIASATPCSQTETAPLINVPLGKSAVLRLQSPASRIILGNPQGGHAARPALIDSGSKTKAAPTTEETASAKGVASVDVVLLNPTEIYLLGKSVGSTNIIVLGRSGSCTIMDIAVGIDTKTVSARLNQFIPGNAIQVTAAADSIVLSGSVADATQVDRAMSIASAFTAQSDAAKVVNMLSVADPQQVMLEVKVAEVSKTLVDKLGANFDWSKINGSWTYAIASGLLSESPSSISGSNAAGTRKFELDAQKKDGLIKILAEPTIMAISGQEGSFLAGGRILIPVAQSNTTGSNTITLEEKEFGVALKFTPTVLASGRINLKVRPEVSELSREGVGISQFGTNSIAVLPLITTRKAETTVQLNDGQSFAIGGLVKNNVTQNIKAFPILGELPLIGALFRSSDFQTDKSELVFIVTPHLVKPLPPGYPLPTDNFIEPSRAEFFIGGKMEGTPPPASPAPAAPASNPSAGSGFELK